MFSEAGAVLIRPMSPDDWPEVRVIFTEGIETGQATFEAAAPEWEQFNASRLPDHRFVAEASAFTRPMASPSSADVNASHA